MSKRTIYKHKFVITILSEDKLEEHIPYPTLADLDYTITSGPDLGWTELESAKKITGREAIIQECQALHNSGGFFTDMWDEWDGDDVGGNP